MNADVTDSGFWAHWIDLAKQIPALGWAGILSALGGVLLPLSIEHGLPDEAKSDPKLPQKSFWGAIALCIAIALLVGWPDWRIALAIGLLTGAACHFLRYGLSKMRWFSWMRAKPRTTGAYDAEGRLYGLHIEGEDKTVAITLPDKTEPKP